jgi:hypothetical protein
MLARMITFLTCAGVLASMVGCATATPNSVREVTENEVNACKLLGNVSGSDAVFVGLSASVGSKNAKARAMNQAVSMGATDVVWSAMGTNMTSEWIGKAYLCNSGSTPSNSKREAVAAPASATVSAAQSVAPPSSPARQTAPMSLMDAQKRLLVLGYQPGPADGVMGKKTTDAIKKFQQDKNLAVTGRLDADTAEKLSQ